MISPYLDRPLLPLALALPPILEQIEAALADVKLSAAEKWCVRQRASLVRDALRRSPGGWPSAR